MSVLDTVFSNVCNIFICDHPYKMNSCIATSIQILVNIIKSMLLKIMVNVIKSSRTPPNLCRAIVNKQLNFLAKKTLQRKFIEKKTQKKNKSQLQTIINNRWRHMVQKLGEEGKYEVRGVFSKRSTFLAK